MAEGVRRIPYYAAIVVAQTAFRAGENIEKALTAAGYGYSVIQGINNYFSNSTETERDQIIANMSAKRQRSFTTTSSTTTGTVSKPVKRYVKRCMSRYAEKKYVDIDVSSTNINPSSTNGSLCSAIVQGTGDGTRTGNQITIRRIFLKGNFTDTVPVRCRLILVWDKLPNANGAAALALVTPTPGINTAYSHDNVVGWGGGRFNILYDKRIGLEPDFSGSTDNAFIFYKSTERRTVIYNASTSAATDVSKGNLLLYLVADAATADFNGILTIEYEDM